MRLHAMSSIARFLRSNSHIGAKDANRTEISFSFAIFAPSRETALAECGDR